MANSTTFAPHWASAPGETILESLRQRSLSVAAFAKRIGRSSDATDKLLIGEETIDAELAERLHRVIGGSPVFWLNRESQYRDDLARIKTERDLQSAKDWLRELPVRDMIKFGWISPPKDRQGQLAECLRFFNVTSVGAWQLNYRAVADVVAFRTSDAFEPHPSAVAAWLRRGEIVAEDIKCHPWDRQKFKDNLWTVRALTRKKHPAIFLPELSHLCAKCGVAMVIARAPTGCRASGATRFVSKDKALLLLSFRYRTDDHFWFTFFHEAGHLVLHDQKALFVEGAGMLSTHEENEADEFAASILVSPEQTAEMMELELEYRTIMRFARRIGISPGIVVGQLQHRRRLERNQMNFLKTRFVWRDA